MLLLNIFLWIIIPVCIYQIFHSIESWIWRLIWLGIVAYAVFGNPFPGSAFVVPIILIIGLALKETMEDHGIKWK